MGYFARPVPGGISLLVEYLKAVFTILIYTRTSSPEFSLPGQVSGIAGNIMLVAARNDTGKNKTFQILANNDNHVWSRGYVDLWFLAGNGH